MGDITSLWSWIPPWILTALNFGQAYPKGDENALYSLATMWDQTGADLRSIEQQARQATSALAANYNSPGAQAFAKEFDHGMFTGPSSFEKTATAMEDLGSYTRSGGNTIETAKIMEAGFAVTTAGTVISLLATLWGALFVAPAIAAGEEVMEGAAEDVIEKVAQEAAEQTLKNLLKAYLKKIVISAAEGFAFDAVPQLIEIAEGNRTSFNWSEAAENAAEWGIGTAISAPLDGALDKGFGGLHMPEGKLRTALTGFIASGTGNMLGSDGTEFAWTAAGQALQGKPITWGKDFSSSFLTPSSLRSFGVGGLMGAHGALKQKPAGEPAEKEPTPEKPPPTSPDETKPNQPAPANPDEPRAGSPQTNGHSDPGPAQHNGQPAGSSRAGAPPVEHGDRPSEIAAGPKDTAPASSQHGEPSGRNADHRVDSTQTDEPTPATAKPDPKDASGEQSGRPQESDPDQTKPAEKSTQQAQEPAQPAEKPSQQAEEPAPPREESTAAQGGDAQNGDNQSGNAPSNSQPSDTQSSSPTGDPEKSSAGGSDSTDNAESSGDADGSNADPSKPASGGDDSGRSGEDGSSEQSSDNAPAATEGKGSEATTPHPSQDGQSQASSHPEEGSPGQQSPVSQSGGDHEGPGGDHTDQPVMPGEQPHAVPPTRVHQAETAWDALTSALDAPEQQVMDTAALAQAAQWFGAEADAPVAAESAEDLAAGLRQVRPDLVVGSPSELSSPETSGASEPSGVVSRLRQAGSGSSALVVENRAGAAGKSLHMLRYEGSSGLSFDGKAVTDRGIDESGRQVLADANGNTYSLGAPDGGSTRADQLAAAAVVVAHEPATAAAPSRAGAARTGEGPRAGELHQSSDESHSPQPSDQDPGAQPKDSQPQEESQSQQSEVGQPPEDGVRDQEAGAESAEGAGNGDGSAPFTRPTNGVDHESTEHEHAGQPDEEPSKQLAGTRVEIPREVRDTAATEHTDDHPPVEHPGGKSGGTHGDGDGKPPDDAAPSVVEPPDGSKGHGQLLSKLMGRDSKTGAGSESTAFVVVDRGNGLGAHVFTITYRGEEHGMHQFLVDGQAVTYEGTDPAGREWFTDEHGQRRTLSQLTGGETDAAPRLWATVWKDGHQVDDVGVHDALPSATPRADHLRANRPEKFDEWVWNRIVDGVAFNEIREPYYEDHGGANEVTLKNGKRLDSYVPNTEIVSRKYSQLAAVKPETAMKYLAELQRKYNPGELVADTDHNRRALPQQVGRRIDGTQVLEVPPQREPVPPEIMSEARRLGIIIREVRDIPGREET